MKTTTEMVMVPTEKLVPYVNNARTHSPEQINKLRGSLREYGFINPIIIDADFNVLAGHGRLEAAKAEGIKEVPCVLADYLTPAQRKAYILADNRMAEDAGWDEEMLKAEIESLQEEAFDLSLTGFDEKELASFFDVEQQDEKEDDFDVEEELKKPCFSKPGDIWHLGKHTVICGDTTLPETFQDLLEGTKVNLVLTDAPYFVDVNYSDGRIMNDNLPKQKWYEFLMKCFKNFHAAMAKDATIYEFYSNLRSRVFYDAFEDAGFKVGAELIWHKQRSPLAQTDWKFNMEPIIYGWREDGTHCWYGGKTQEVVFEFDSPTNNKKTGFGHPASKPVPMLAYLIKLSTMTNGLVLDGFLGSASTLIACAETGRICYGIELDPKYVDVAVERYRLYLQEREDQEADPKDAEIYCIRDGERLSYDEVKQMMEETKEEAE